MSAHHPPVLGEPLPIELANTRFVQRRQQLEGLKTPEDLVNWLRRVGDRLPVTPSDRDLESIGPQDLTAARELRDAIRVLLDDATTGTALNADAAETLNKAVRKAPRWPELSVATKPTVMTRTTARPVTAALAGIAEQAIWLLTGSEAPSLRACHAPGCILFYRQDHPRRAWCSPKCSNRARSARHYARHNMTKPHPTV